MEQQLMKKGWYNGLARRFSNHYFVTITKRDIKSRCGQINIKMLNGKSVSELKLINPKSAKNICASCKFLLDQDEIHTQMVEPYRY